MLANLKKERLRLFKQYIFEEKRKNCDISKTLMTSKMPKIDEALIGITENSYLSGEQSGWLDESSRIKQTLKSVKGIGPNSSF